MTFSDLQTEIGRLTTDQSHDRYPLPEINTELDNTQDKWNLSAKIIKDTVTLTTVAGTRQYSLSGLTGTVISFARVTHKGIDLTQRSKAWLDLYTSADWTLQTGTPTLFFIEQSDPDVQFLTVYPTPTDNDTGANLVAEYIKRHTSMSAASDVPFMSGTSSNSILRPYDWGIAYDVSARLLTRYPSQENAARAASYAQIANGVMAEVIQTFKALEKEQPLRLAGGRSWVY